MSISTLLARPILAFSLLVLATCFACDSQSDAERAAAVAKQIKKTPKNAEAILEEHDMTIEEFEKLMYDVAADPELAKQYQAALKSKQGK